MPDSPTLDAIERLDTEIAALHACIDGLVVRIGRLEEALKSQQVVASLNLGPHGGFRAAAEKP